MADVKWIKIVTDMFNNRKIKQIEAMPDADAVLIIWVKLLCLAGNINENGAIMITRELPYTDEMLSQEFGKPLNTIRMALSIFEKYSMIEIIENVYCISNWQKYQNIDGMDRIREQTRLRVSALRSKRKLLPDVTLHVTQCNATDIELDKEIEIERDKEKISKYGEFNNVSLTDHELTKITNRYGSVVRDKKIEDLSNYLKSTGRKYKDHYATILAWCKKDCIPEIKHESVYKHDTPMLTEEDQAIIKQKMQGLSWMPDEG